MPPNQSTWAIPFAICAVWSVVQVEEMLAKILFIPPITVNSIKAVKMSNR